MAKPERIRKGVVACSQDEVDERQNCALMCMDLLRVLLRMQCLARFCSSLCMTTCFTYRSKAIGRLSVDEPWSDQPREPRASLRD